MTFPVRHPLPLHRHGTPGIATQQALELTRGQRLLLTCYHDETYTLEEIMPPLLNTARFRMPNEADEAEMRKLEWQQLEAL